MRMCTLWCSAFLLCIQLVTVCCMALKNKIPLVQHSPRHNDPLLLRAARGENVERTPVWMMRQAGRHMQAYRKLCEKHKTFRERSENADLATEISMQPWRAYKTDGVILFSDILTPLPGMGIEFDISEKLGPRIKPLQDSTSVQSLRSLDPYEATPFVAETLRNLRHLIDTEAGEDKPALLGFTGLPFTLAAYIIEGGGSEDFRKIKQAAFDNKEFLKQLLQKLADDISTYAIFQIENGAQAIQLFDSWAGVLSPYEYDEFALPYQQQIIANIKSKYPQVPIILYIHRSGALLERMAASGADILSLDWTTKISEARQRLGTNIGVQGNFDPMMLFASKDEITRRVVDILKEGRGQKHIMNLGHGIHPETSEEKVAHFVDMVKAIDPADYRKFRNKIAKEHTM